MNVTVRGLCLAWGAVVALLAYPAGAQFLGDQRAILGGEGFYRPLGVAASVTIDAPAYTRTVTASSYTLTGTSVGSGAVSWSASPSGSSGACTGTDSFSCVVTVTPDAVGEGVETITVTRGAATDTETLGFYVAGAHSTFLSQNVNGTYNAGVADLDAVSTWENVGTSALDVTQATGSAKPTFRTSIVGGQPVVDFDGGDSLLAAVAADWTFLHDGTTWDSEAVAKRDDTTTRVVFGNNTAATSCASTAAAGICVRFEGTNTLRALQTSGGGVVSAANTTATMTTATFNLLRAGITSADVFAAINANAATTATKVVVPSLVASGVLGVGLHPGGAGTAPLDGPVFRLMIYQSALDATQRGINKAVDEWALGGALPVTP